MNTEKLKKTIDRFNSNYEKTKQSQYKTEAIAREHLKRLEELTKHYVMPEGKKK